MEQAQNRKQLMTEGPIGRQIIMFALPLLLGNIFQQLYNTVDAMIVGRYVGTQALAAVGSAGSVVHLIVSLLMGVTMGASVVIANHYGARNIERMRKAVHTAVMLALFAGVALTIIGVSMAEIIVGWIGTPDNVVALSTNYLRIIFMGVIGSMLYNVGSSIFRAVGDSKRPLYYLIFSSITNIVLDLLFVAVLKMGVQGAAFATILSQLASAAVTFLKLATEKSEYQLNLKELAIDRQEAGLIIRIGIPGGIQNSVIALSNVVVQANINSFNDVAMAGCAAYVKIDGFAVMPAISCSMALTTFIGQNMGAKKSDRMKKGARFGIIMAAVTVECLGLLLYFFAEPLIGMFDSDPRVIYYGAEMAKTVAPLYIFLGLSHAMGGVLRGAGLTKVPMVVMILCWCAERVAWITLSIRFIANDIHMVFWGYPITWITSTILFLLYYYKTDWIHHSLDKKEK